MSFLVVAVFNDELRAQQAMSELVRLYKPRPDLENALILTWNGRDPIAQQSQNLADRKGAGWGVLWGNLLHSVISGMDEVEAAVSTLRGQPFGQLASRKRPVQEFWNSVFGVPADFIRDVAALITPGRSAIFFVSRCASLHIAADVTHGYGGTLLSAPLDTKQMAKIRRYVNSQSAF